MEKLDQAFLLHFIRASCFFCNAIAFSISALSCTSKGRNSLSQKFSWLLGGRAAMSLADDAACGYKKKKRRHTNAKPDRNERKSWTSLR
jgi:hypothetical protein